MSDRSKPILVGFTGGLRSSVLSVLLKEQGFEVSGLYLDLSEFSHPLWTSVCGSVGKPKHLQTAQENADKLGIPLQVVSGAGLFEQKIVDPTIHAALLRKEEHPGVLFHSELLLPVLHQVALEMGCESWATGHRVLTQGKDLLLSDQVHWIAFSARTILDSGSFPLGGFQESHLSKLAAQIGVTDPSDLPSGHHPAVDYPDLWKAWVEPRLSTEFLQRGWVRHPRISTGLTEHPGVFSFPIGTPISLSDEEQGTSSLIAVDYDLASHTLWAMHPEQTERRSLTLEDVSWWDSSVHPLGETIELLVCSSTGHTQIASAQIQFHPLQTARLDLHAATPNLFLGTRILLLKDRRIVGHARVSSSMPLGEIMA
jgi:tRNA U34 2-thiouridine synthase MnmA/TrmU